MNNQIETDGSKIVQHVPVIHLYRVSQDKLEHIKTAAKTGSIELTLATFLLSVGISFILTTFTTDIKYPVMKYIFSSGWIASVVGLIYIFKYIKDVNKVDNIVDGIINSKE